MKYDEQKVNEQKPQAAPHLTIGQDRVRAEFNPSADNTVDLIKQKTAELIDICETLKNRDARLAGLAQTSFEGAAMWAVKAATAPLR